MYNMKNRQIYGYAGKILRVDLTAARVSVEPTIKYAHEWIGGSGLAQWILYNEVKPGIGPLDPGNKLIIGTGTFNGTLAPGSSRVTADSKSPMTGGVGSSNSDGFFSTELKFAGYDLIVFEGKASKPMYLWIDDDRVELRDAFHLWGKTTWETDEAIKQDRADDRVQIMCIGPAGEHLVRGACIIVNKGRACGRCGLGAVMGSKNLKAIAVRGTGAVEVADPARFMDAVDNSRKIFANEGKESTQIRYGTLRITANKQNICGIPYRNFQYLDLPGDAFTRVNKAIDDWQTAYRVRNIGYPACPRPCDRYFKIDGGPYAGLECGGAQFEILADFAGKLGVDEPDFLIKINAYCNQLGLDIDLAAGSIGWAMECYQRGILKNSDTDGMKLDWGDTDVILELTRKIAYREGFGDILGDGCARCAKKFGKESEYFALHVKGQDLYEVIRSAIGWGLGVCVSTRGGGHTTGAPALETSPMVDLDLAEKVYGVRALGNPLAFEGKAELVGYMELQTRINNSTGLCHSLTTWTNPAFMGLAEIAELYSAATGWETTEDDLKRKATRMLTVEKAFNIRHAGFSRKDDYPPPRCLQEPIPRGSAAGFQIGREKWDRLLDEYYEMHNWDKETGFPTRECLEELDLEEIADDLEKADKLGKRETH
jgi:aldehyde:ferredoxin oxidoreductase